MQLRRMRCSTGSAPARRHWCSVRGIGHCPGGCKAAPCGVLGRANMPAYWRSLRPCLACFSRARISTLAPGRSTRLRAEGKRSPTTRSGGPMNFDIKTEQVGDHAYVISLAGEVDLYTAPEFKQQLLEVIGQGGKEVVVDFSDTTFIDSTTL